MRCGVIAVLVLSGPAAADPIDRLEASGFVGEDYFGDDIALGGSVAPEQRPQASPTFGGRVTYLPLRLGEGILLDAGVEAEVSFTASWTGYGSDSARSSYFAPVFGYRVNGIARLGIGDWLQPHAIVGAGGATVVSSSPYMSKETDPVFPWGLGRRSRWVRAGSFGSTAARASWMRWTAGRRRRTRSRSRSAAASGSPAR